MSKAKGLDVTVRIVFFILLGFLTLFLSLIFLAVFVAVAGYYLWKLQDKTKELEERLSALEGPSRKKPDKN
jgi:flagellar biogenesis protein FliO